MRRELQRAGLQAAPCGRRQDLRHDTPVRQAKVGHADLLHLDLLRRSRGAEALIGKQLLRGCVELNFCGGQALQKFGFADAADLDGSRCSKGLGKGHRDRVCPASRHGNLGQRKQRLTFDIPYLDGSMTICHRVFTESEA
ncbi:hypothetical protein [Inhella sp.]|uniref:hypothetical protein n=1 Tax=Inhella sp. TaxID=1921806 RepID=UPI0035AF52BC